MKKLALIVCILLLICTVLPSCTDKTPVPGSSTSITTKADDETPDPVIYHYGRLSLENSFIMKTGNDVRFTVQFEKKVYNPGDDIVLTVYAANYTGEDLTFDTADIIHARQELIHVSLTYGDGTYEIPLTYKVDENDKDLENGSNVVEIPNRSLISCTFVLHTSEFENVEESIFGEKFINTYQLKLWLGDDTEAYYVELPLNYIPFTNAETELLENICLPNSYVKVLGDIRFTVEFDKTEYNMDDDIIMHVKVENLGKDAVGLYYNADINDPIYYLRASLKFGTSGIVRDTVKSPSEIPGLMESVMQLKGGESIERDITFYASDFSNFDQSLFSVSMNGQRTLRVYLCVKEGSYEIEVPITTSTFKAYSYNSTSLYLAPSYVQVVD